MKKLILTVAAVTLYSLTSHAGFYCEYNSAVGGGWGESYSLGAAKSIAYNNCRAYSGPYACYFSGCQRTYYSEEAQTAEESIGGILELEGEE